METSVETKPTVERNTIAGLRFEQQMEILERATLTDFIKGTAEVAHYSSLGCLGPAMAWMQIERTKDDVTEITRTRRVRSYFKEGFIHLHYDDELNKGFRTAFTKVHVSYDPYGEDEPKWELEEKTYDQPTQEVIPFTPTEDQEMEFRGYVTEALQRRREENIERCRRLGYRAHMIVVQPHSAYI